LEEKGTLPGEIDSGSIPHRFDKRHVQQPGNEAKPGSDDDRTQPPAAFAYLLWPVSGLAGPASSPSHVETQWLSMTLASLTAMRLLTVAGAAQAGRNQRFASCFPFNRAIRPDLARAPSRRF
jgi:hypothetical protein